MKKHLILIFPLLSLWNQTLSQSTTICPTCNTAPGPNQGIGGEFLGWNNLNALNLDLRNDNFYPIYWWTNTVSRMQIYEDQAAGTAVNSGFVGIGEFATSGFIPYSLLHLNSNDNDAAPNTFMQVTNANTGFGTDRAGLQVGVLYDGAPNFYTGGPQGTGTDYSIAALRQWMDAPMIFYTNDNNGNLSERMRIAYGNGGSNANTTKVNISYASAGVGFPIIGINMPPVAMLNLGEDAYSGILNVGVGQRAWMDVGTFGALNTDDFYVGLKNERQDQNDAVFVWGDNYTSPQVRDYLRFIFSASVDKNNDIGLAGAVDGLEVARFTPQGHFGIGNYTMTFAAGGSRVEPARMLEVYDASINNPTLNTPNPSAPQLRLTFTPTNFQGGGNTGIFADFYCDRLGDLYFDTRDQNNPLFQRNVGIGKVGNFNAQSQLHQHLDANNDAWHQFTNLNTGSTVTDGFRAGLRFDVTTTSSWAELRQLENAPMAFYTNDASTNLKERMKITYGNGWNGAAVADVTKVNISYGPGPDTPIQREVAMLNLGKWAPIGGGQRPWMDVGTFGCLSTDNFYYGLKYESIDHVDAVISWGDNLNGADGADNLRVIAVMKNATPGQQGTTDGLEVSRFAPTSYVGIGNFAATGQGGSGIQPARRLEIYDEHLLNSNSAQPQLRLTYQPDANPLLGIWTDFQSMGTTGDLQINNSGNGTTNYVGIANGTNALTRMLDVNGNGRFRTLPSATNNSLDQLVVTNSSGELFVRDVSTLPVGGGGVNVCGGGGLNNFIPRFTNSAGNIICNSIVRQGLYNSTIDAIGIGYLSTGTFFGKLDIDGDLNLSQTVSTPQFKIYNQSVLHIPGTANCFIGATTGTGTNIGRDNTFVGNGLGINIGANGDYNTIIGSTAGTALTDGDKNFIGGSAAAQSLTTHSNNVIIGESAALGYNNNNGTLVGYQAAYNQNGANNTVIGYQALSTSTTSITAGEKNTIVGLQAGREAGAGSRNVYIGESAGYNDDGDENVFIGEATGYNNSGTVVCNSSTLIGRNIRINGGSRDGVTAIGAGARPNCADCVTLGDVGTTSNNDRTLIGYASAPTGGTNWSASRLYVNVVGTETNAAWFNGDVSANGVFNPSDSSLKSNIQSLPQGNAEIILNALNPQTYTFNQAGNPQLNLPSGPQCGLMAQELEQILPGLVSEFTTPPLLDSLGNIINPELTYKAINYTGLIPYLIQALKEGNQRSNDLSNQLAAMQSQLDNCCNAGNRHIHQNNNELSNSIDVKLKNTKAIILNQNVPNPFAEQTSITYFINDEVKSAVIYFYDNKGAILKTVEINEKGAGQINVFAADLSSGAYTYSLIADGKLIETKIMMKTN